MMQNIQNKIDRLIQTANSEFSNQNNVVSALVLYSRAYNLSSYLSRNDRIQIHEMLVRIAICWDILGNYENALDYLTKAIEKIKNISFLYIYKSVLERSLNKHRESLSDLNKYHSLVKAPSKEMNLELIFTIVYSYIKGGYDKEKIVKEINEYFEKYNKCTILLFLRAKMNYEIASEMKRNINKDNEQDYKVFIKRYENDISTANQIENNDTACLIKDGITSGNLTKLFFMILPEMDYYQPKPLVNYSRFHSGFKLFYVLKKICKLLRAKIKRKKIKIFFVNKIKKVRYKYSKNVKVKGGLQYSNSSLLGGEQNSITKSGSKSKSKSPVNATGRKDNEEEEVKQVKIEYEKMVKKLYESVFVKSKNQYDTIEAYDFDTDISVNYFIRDKFYAPFNISKNIIIEEKVKENEALPEFGKILSQNENFLNDLSVSVIKVKKENMNDISEINDIKMLEKNTPKFVKNKNILSMTNLNKDKKSMTMNNISKPASKKSVVPMTFVTSENAKKRKISPDIVVSNIKFKLLSNHKKEIVFHPSKQNIINERREKSFDL